MSHTYNKTCYICDYLCMMPICRECGGTCTQEDPADINKSLLTERLQKWADGKVDEFKKAYPDPVEVKKASAFADVVIPAGRPLVEEDFRAAGGQAFIPPESGGPMGKSGGPKDGGAFNDRYPEHDDDPRPIYSVPASSIPQRVPVSDAPGRRDGQPAPMVTLALAERQQALLEQCVILIDKQQCLIDRLLREAATRDSQ